jgi:F1F0 ATPase subunit 2
MNEPILSLVFSFIAGLGFGMIHFGGLWFSIRHLLSKQRAAEWFLISFVVRTFIVLLGFYWTMDGHPEKLMIALFGFSLVRVIMSKRVGGKMRSGV